MPRRFRTITKPDQHISGINQTSRARHPDRFNPIIGAAKPCRISQADRNAAQRQRDLDMVARSARYVRDNCPVFASYRIDKARLTGVRWARDDNEDAILERLDAGP